MIVIGGSLGGAAAIGEILRRLPGNFPLPIAVTLHRHKESYGMLVPVLQLNSALPIFEVEDKMPIEPARVFLCPPDYHLMFDAECFSLSTDDLVNFARPSIDVMFESAAEWYHDRVIAIVLTGASSDGAAGAVRVQTAGGLVIAQDPKTAEGLWMPSAAITATGTRHVMPPARMATMLTRLARLRRAA